MKKNWKIDKLGEKGLDFVILLTGNNKDNIPIYNYLLVPRKQVKPFVRALDKPRFALSKFEGIKVIESGLGSPTKFLHEEVMMKIGHNLTA